MKANEWTIKEVTLLKANWTNPDEAAIMALFPNRTWCAIYNHMLSIGLRKRWKYKRNPNYKPDDTPS